jgi:hypothetical protein
MLDMEVIELSLRAVAAEGGGIIVTSRRSEQGSEFGVLLLALLFFNAVGPESRDAAFDVDPHFVERVAEIFTGVAADDDVSFLREKAGHRAGLSFHDDVAAF